MMKRCRDYVASNTRSKTPKLINGLDIKKKTNCMVSASNVFNYMIKDTLIDWLKFSNRCGTRSTPIYREANGFHEFIMERGVEFENNIVKYINKHFFSIISVSSYITEDSVRKTKELIYEGVPIIHSACVKDEKSKTQGIIDLLVRSDYINKLVDNKVVDEEEMFKYSYNLNKCYYYIVIDIKFSTLSLAADGIHILNSGNYAAYKSQCLIYTDIVGKLQGYTSSCAFILGRRWSKGSDNTRNFSCLNKLGRISYDSYDKKYIELTKNAIKWVRNVQNNHSCWSVNPPSIKELYPNMCLYSGLWNSEKQKIADNIGEMTNIWYVGVENRNKAIDKGINSWRDPRCTSKILEINGKRAPIIDAILNINRQSVDNILPKVIRNNLYNWKSKELEVYVDFETLSDVFSTFENLPYQHSTDMIFMIGVGWIEDNKWNYKNFICNKLEYNEEYKIMNKFVEFMIEKDIPKIYYWSAEKNFWKNAENRLFDLNFDKKSISEKWNLISEKWSDLHQVFQQEPIVIKDCFKFGLKPIAKAMKKHGMINVSIDSKCNDGMSAMIGAWKYYNQNNKEYNKEYVMEDISKYNEFDCKVLYEILNYLRKNNV